MTWILPYLKSISQHQYSWVKPTGKKIMINDWIHNTLKAWELVRRKKGKTDFYVKSCANNKLHRFASPCKGYWFKSNQLLDSNVLKIICSTLGAIWYSYEGFVWTFLSLLGWRGCWQIGHHTHIFWDCPNWQSTGTAYIKSWDQIHFKLWCNFTTLLF